MTRDDILQFVRSKKLAVVSTVTADGKPQSALVGIAVTYGGEIVFDTLASTRKMRNLPGPASLVVGWDDETTVQLEGRARVAEAAEISSVQQPYFATFPDGAERAAWPGIRYVIVEPTWMRYASYAANPPVIVEVC